jgi:hypothetical protein
MEREKIDFTKPNQKIVDDTGDSKESNPVKDSPLYKEFKIELAKILERKLIERMMENEWYSERYSDDKLTKDD